MNGYEVVTTDERKVGRVVATTPDFLVVESGTLFRSRHPVPKEFAHADDERRLVVVTLSKSILKRSPKLKDEASIDEDAARAYYGLGAPGPTEGSEDTNEPTVRERAEVREQLGAEGDEEHGPLGSTPAVPKDELPLESGTTYRPPPG
jgi:hypothetical protein